MKPANFPDRKLQRQINAITTLTGAYRNNPSPEAKARIMQSLDNTMSNIAGVSSRRDERTKKVRGYGR